MSVAMADRGLICLFILLEMSSPASARREPSPAIVRLRSDAVPIDPGLAVAMKPDALGDAILAPGHPIVDEAVVGPEGMDPPISPTMPVATQIKLFLHPVADEPPGFCRRTEVDLHLKLAGRTAGGGISPTVPEAMTTKQAFRWIGGRKSAAGCAAPRTS